MLAKVNSDYSKYPATIRELMPDIEGQVFLLRDHWQVYSYCFLENEARTKFISPAIGPLLGLLQELLGYELILSVARLTDPEKGKQKNLSLWVLEKAIPFSKRDRFGDDVRSALKEIYDSVPTIRKFRHKLLAHLDSDIAIGKNQRPDVLHNEIESVLNKMEALLNLFHMEFKGVPTYANIAAPIQYIEPAFVTAFKAKAYDELEEEGKVPKDDWQQRAEKYRALFGFY